MENRVERYRKPIRFLHWIHAAAFVFLVITGIFLFIPGLGFLAQDSYSRVVHRVGAALFVVIPGLYLLINFKRSVHGIKEAFSWGVDDLGWLQAAPKYYFLGDEKAMPPQDHMNTGQKLYWLIVLVFGTVIAISGALMWFFKNMLPSGVFQWSVFAHDVAFIVIVSMFFVHIYLSVIHPLMAGVIRSMIDGTVPEEYAKSHHAKWYERYLKEKSTKAAKEQAKEQR